jgi:hypothetical protein
MNLKDLCKKYDLEATKEFWATENSELEKIYNGAGPDWLPAWGRAVLTEFLEIFQAAFVVHDYDYAVADKTEEGFKIVNERMWRNMKKILDLEYPFARFWLWGFRSRWWLRARAAYRACQKLGWSAWLDD